MRVLGYRLMSLESSQYFGGILQVLLLYILWGEGCW